MKQKKAQAVRLLGKKHPLIIAWALADAQKRAAAEFGMRSEEFRKACEDRQ